MNQTTTKDSSMSNSNAIHAKAIELIKLSVEMTTAAGSGHPSSAASLAHLTAALMYQHMRWEPGNPGHPASDRLVLSEGHAVPIVYAAGADLGIAIGKGGNLRPMTREDAMNLRAIDSEIDGHPNPVEGFPFFDAATGSLGQGLSVAAGLGCAARVDGINKRIYCIIGDGESREGQIWEAAEFIIDHNLTSVCPIFNCNVYAQSDKVSKLQTPEITAKKLEAIGFEVRIIDGHNPDEITAALNDHAGTSTPLAIVANTVKGWGAASMQGHGHHGVPIKADQVPIIAAELDETGKTLGAQDTEISIPAITEASPVGAQVKPLPSFTDAMKQLGKESILEGGKFATRKAYGVALRILGQTNPNVVALDADVKNSTFAIDFYNDQTINDRFFECRIAEQNMVSAAAGLSAGGKIPFASTFAKFVVRGYDQLEMAINSGANIKIVGSHAGVSLAADGPSQMSLPDIAWMRAFGKAKLPNGTTAMYLIQPADAFAAYALCGAMADHDGPCYMRTLRPESEFLYNDETPFTLGGHQVLEEGRDLLICASGYTVHETLKAMDAIREAGIDATLVDLYSLPFDDDAIVELAKANNNKVLTVEDNYAGGFGSAVADALTASGGAFSVNQMYVQQVPKSGRTPDEVMNYLGLSAAHIVEAAKNATA